MLFRSVISPTRMAVSALTSDITNSFMLDTLFISAKIQKKIGNDYFGRRFFVFGKLKSHLSSPPSRTHLGLRKKPRSRPHEITP